MKTGEKRIIDWLIGKMPIIVLGIATIMAILIRLSLRGWISFDMSYFLIPWTEEIRSMGGIHALSHQVGDYSTPYQFVLALLTYLPFDDVYHIKLVSCVFDFSLAIGMVFLLKEILGSRITSLTKVFAFSAVMISPLVFLNSAAWGQCDAIYSSFLVWSLYFCVKEKYICSFVLYGVAISFKLQAIFFLPVLLILYAWKKRFSIICLGIIPIVYFAMNIPALLFGRSIRDLLAIYFYQTSRYRNMYIDYPSFWRLFIDDSEKTYMTYSSMAIFVTFTVLLLLVLYVLRKIEYSEQNLVWLSFLCVYTCVLFLPSMHERYGYFQEILGISLVFINRKTIIPFVMNFVTILYSYGNNLFQFQSSMGDYVAIINFASYIVYMYIFLNVADRRLSEDANN